MCKDQRAQVNCMVNTCIFHGGAGKCVNVSPALSLNRNNTFTCWSRQDRDAVR